ncbi:hypothetical protein [Corynebacterium caspium]|uniref:hypothetical protein n=2 Tax=Corynebacterium caspium TaxID=234828 RepID=UPI000364FDA6|nr:hypothetical protein [Corynebacterium caspium]WKD60027.1 hypothetical protein CCASP_08275 [Corynebacterium caspium DSM 44850]
MMIITMASVFLGFFCIAGAFLAYMKQWRPLWTWLLGAGALVFVMIIPTLIAVFYAAINPQ